MKTDCPSTDCPLNKDGKGCNNPEYKEVCQYFHEKENGMPADGAQVSVRAVATETNSPT